MKSILVLSILLLICQATCSYLPLVSNVFGSNMVLQREPQNARIWGWSTADVSLNLVSQSQQKETYTATPDANGKWTITLAPKPAGGPYYILVSGDVPSVNLTNVMFGDVFWCSGQSNMEFSVGNSIAGLQAIQSAGNYTHIRLTTVPKLNPPTSYDQWTPSLIINGSLMWYEASPGRVNYFSAVCWYHAQHISDAQNKTVPLGLISNSWGGTNIEKWMSPQLYNASGCVSARTGHKQEIFNLMVYPFAPMALRAMYWYQGEANADNPDYYACILPKFADEYRMLFQSDMPFTFVQLAPINYTGDYWPTIRARQFDAFMAMGDNTCMVSTNDLGHLESLNGPLHPQKKEPIGYRAHLCTRRLVYGEQLTWNGPIPLCATLNNVTNEITVSFVKDTLGDGLVLQEVTCPYTDTRSATICKLTWEVNNGTDSKNWVNATYALSEDRTQVILSGGFSLPSNQSLIKIRYAWGSFPLATVFNSVNIPAPSFVIGLSECPVEPPVAAPVDANSPSSSNAPNSATSDSARQMLSLLVLVVLLLWI